MSEPVASTLVEVVPAPQNQPPPDPKPKPEPKPSAPQGAVPGVPLAVAVANALGAAGAGAASLGGGAVAVVGAAAGAAALGCLARKARKARNRHTNPRPSARTVAAHRAGGAGGLPPARVAGSNFASPQSRAANSAAAARRSGPGSAGSRGGAGVPAHHTADPKGRPGMQRTAGTTHHAAHRAGAATGGSSRQAGRPGSGTGYRPPAIVHTLAKAASRLPGLKDPAPAGRSAQRPARRDERLARVAERTARRVEKGQAKALRAAGIDPATGSGARSKSPAGSAGAGRVSPVQAKALKRSAMRHRARMGGAALATGLVGIGSALAGNWKHKGKVAGHMRRTWQRLATRARAVRQTRDSAILGKQAADGTQVPVPAETVNVPGRRARAVADALASAFPRRQQPGEGPGTSPAGADGLVFELFGRPSRPDTTPAVDPITLGKPTVKETAMSESLDGTAATFSLTSAADVILQAATTFDPETMGDFKALIEELPAAFTTLQDVLRVLAEKAAEQLPVDPSVVEEIGSGYRAMGRVVNALEEVGPTFRQAHADDLERQENPRNGLEAERKWNV
ncbi:hypothetical protein ACIRRH_01275 [Kitasatospora sp. NPDC101235]|uniref:hypothetical protein n=1 Tax=Kitasatospora sp. NPDC101235 TaxID=3364101 RepID=UPI0037F1DF53